MNPLITEIPPSLIRAIHALKQPGDIDLGLGEPTLRPDPALFDAATEWVRANGCPYSPNAGFEELRAGIARYLRIPGMGEAANVCVTVGSEEALYLAVKALLDATEDEVLIVEPCYLVYPKLCMMEGVRYRTVVLDADDDFRPRADLVLEALRPETRLIMLNTPANPTGRVWPASELETLARGLAERAWGPVYVLSDEVYRELYFTAEPPASMARFHPFSLVAGSLSKSNALTGLRLGWLAGPTDFIAAAVKVHQFVNTAADTFAQRVAIELFRDPSRLGEQREWYRSAHAGLLAAAAEHDLEMIRPEGAFYAFLRLPPALAEDSVAAVAAMLEETRVVTVPGRAFGAGAEGWIRLSWVPEPALVREGVGRIAGYLGAVGVR